MLFIDGQRTTRVFALSQSTRMYLGIALERREKLREPLEGHGEAVLDGAHAERDSDVLLDHARRPLDPQRLALADPRIMQVTPSRRRSRLQQSASFVT